MGNFFVVIVDWREELGPMMLLIPLSTCKHCFQKTKRRRHPFKLGTNWSLPEKPEKPNTHTHIHTKRKILKTFTVFESCKGPWNKAKVKKKWCVGDTSQAGYHHWVWLHQNKQCQQKVACTKCMEICFVGSRRDLVTSFFRFVLCFCNFEIKYKTFFKWVKN